MELLDRLLLHDKFEIEGLLRNVEEKLLLAKEKDFTIEKISSIEFKFLNKVSFGVLTFGYTYCESININARFETVEQNKVAVFLFTKLRGDLIFIAILTFILLLVMIYFQLFEDAYIPIWVNIIVFPVPALWFGFIYRQQEKLLKHKVERFIKVRLTDQKSQ